MPNHLLHLTAMEFLFSLLIIVVVAAGELGRSAVQAHGGWWDEHPSLKRMGARRVASRCHVVMGRLYM